MIPPASPLRAAALLSVSLLGQPLPAAPPNPPTAAEVSAIRQDAASKAPAAAAASAAAHASLHTDLAAAASASQDAAAFLAQADLPPATAASGEAARALDITPGTAATVIHCAGGMYFDADEGVLVYLKNVTVTDPRFNLSGADELKIFFEKRPAETPKEAEPKEAEPKEAEPKEAEPKSPGNRKADMSKAGFGGNVGGNFGDVERIVATGAVKIEQKAAEGNEPIKASGAIFTYNLKSDQIILSGGYPWFTRGTTYMRAKEPNLILRLSPKTGNFVTEGNWEMGGELEPKK